MGKKASKVSRLTDRQLATEIADCERLCEHAEQRSADAITADEADYWTDVWMKARGRARFLERERQKRRAVLHEHH